MLIKLKPILTLLFFVIVVQSIAAVKIDRADEIILRNGTEMYVNIVQVDDVCVEYLPLSKNATVESLELGNVYMMKFSKRGNVYITQDGKRRTGENQKLSKDADVIYLVSGMEIPAYEVQVNENKITYLVAPRKKKTMIPIAEILQPSDVFMIKYSDGTKDIINKIPTLKELEEMQKPVEVEPVKEEPKQPEMQVVFYNVKRGDTLMSIAKEYGVTTDELKEWNDLPSNLKPTAKLRADMQFMIYVQTM
jgi:LysM repeat protein